MVPMSVIDKDLEPTSLGSQVVGHLLNLPIGEPSPVVRLHQVSYALKAHKETGKAVAADRLAGVAGFAPDDLPRPRRAGGRGTLRHGFSLVVTNVPGPAVPALRRGRPDAGDLPGASRCFPGHALAIGVTSYDGRVYYGLTADRDALPDLDVLGQCITEALEELVDSATGSRTRAPRGRSEGPPRTRWRHERADLPADDADAAACAARHGRSRRRRPHAARGHRRGPSCAARCGRGGPRVRRLLGGGAGVRRAARPGGAAPQGRPGRRRASARAPTAPTDPDDPTSVLVTGEVRTRQVVALLLDSVDAGRSSAGPETRSWPDRRRPRCSSSCASTTSSAGGPPRRSRAGRGRGLSRARAARSIGLHRLGWGAGCLTRSRHGRRHLPSRPGQRAEPQLRARQPRAGGARASSWPSCRRPAGRADRHHRRRKQDGRRRGDRGRPAARPRSTCSASLRGSTQADARAAIAAARDAAPGWAAMAFDDRAAVLLKAADLLAGPWRQRLNAATMLGQSKTAYQAEIDSACELIDFWRFNVHFARADPRRAADRQRPRHLEPHRPPPARGLRLRDHAVQLHRHRRQPADGARR